MRYYFITGASRGIGKAMAEILLEDADNDITGFARADNIEYAPNYAHVHVDFNNLEEPAKYDFPELTDADEIILVNNAGALSEIYRMGKKDSRKIISDFNVNIIAPALLINNFIKAYQDYVIPRTIINVSSGAARRPVDAWSVYSSSKAALDMLNETINAEQEFYPEKNRIKAFSVAPGVIDTKMQDAIREADISEFSGVERFIELKKNNELSSPEKAARQLLDIIKNRDTFSDTLLDVRKI